MFARCEHSVSEVLRLVRSAKSPDQVAALKKAAQDTDAILSWIDDEHHQPLSAQGLENHALLLNLFEVPLLNSHMSLAGARQRKKGSQVKIPRSVVILAAEKKLANPEPSWAQIAIKCGVGKSNSLRKAVEYLRKFCQELAIDIPQSVGKKSG
jgi:hypothetical protein